MLDGTDEFVYGSVSMGVWEASKTHELNNCVSFIFLYEHLNLSVMVSRDGSFMIVSEQYSQRRGPHDEIGIPIKRDVCALFPLLM